MALGDMKATVIEIDVDKRPGRLPSSGRGGRPGCSLAAIGAKPADTDGLVRDRIRRVRCCGSHASGVASRVWKAKDGPGAWLTHGTAPAPVTISRDDGA